MRVYPKGSKKALPEIDYVKIQSGSSLWSFLTFFARKAFFNYGVLFVKPEYKDSLTIPTCFYRYKCRLQHNKNILMMYVTENLFVFDSFLIQSALINKKIFITRKNIIKYISEAAVQNDTTTQVIDMRNIKEDSPELKFICSLQQI